MAGTAATITMSMCEVDRVTRVQAVVDRMLPVRLAAQRLGLSRRQLERLVLKYRAQGPRGWSPPSSVDPATTSSLRRSPIVRSALFAIATPTSVRRSPTRSYKCHGLILAKETVRLLMTPAGLWKPRRQQAAQIHQPRNRRACVGELIQIDGSDHAWFECRAAACTLLVFVDDATGRLIQLPFAPTDTAFAYFEATRAYLEKRGKPVAFYSDKASGAVPRRAARQVQSRPCRSARRRNASAAMVLPDGHCRQL